MGQRFAELFDEGANGTTITTGNSAFTTVTAPPSGGTFAFDSTHVDHGALACKVATGSTAGQPTGHFAPSDGTAQQYFRAYYYFTANPGAELYIAYAGTGSGGNTRCSRLGVSSAGKLTLDTSASSAAVVTMAGNIPLNQWFRVEVDLFGDASAGTLALRQYNTTDSSTATASGSASSLNLGGVPNDWRVGMINSLASTGPYWIGKPVVSTSAQPGPYLAASSWLMGQAA